MAAASAWFGEHKEICSITLRLCLMHCFPVEHALPRNVHLHVLRRLYYDMHVLLDYVCVPTA